MSIVSTRPRKEIVISPSMARLALALWFVVVVGCSGTNRASYETVYLRNATTGQVVTCGPYKLTRIGSPATANPERSCIDDYQRQGFVREPVSE